MHSKLKFCFRGTFWNIPPEYFQLTIGSICGCELTDLEGSPYYPPLLTLLYSHHIQRNPLFDWEKIRHFMVHMLWEHRVTWTQTLLVRMQTGITTLENNLLLSPKVDNVYTLLYSLKTSTPEDTFRIFTAVLFIHHELQTTQMLTERRLWYLHNRILHISEKLTKYS